MVSVTSFIMINNTPEYISCGIKSMFNCECVYMCLALFVVSGILDSSESVSYKNVTALVRGRTHYPITRLSTMVVAGQRTLQKGVSPPTLFCGPDGKYRHNRGNSG